MTRLDCEKRFEHRNCEAVLKVIRRNKSREDVAKVVEKATHVEVEVQTQNSTEVWSAFPRSPELLEANVELTGIEYYTS